jgi:hypothetical protein
LKKGGNKMTYAQQKLIEDLIDWQKNDIVLG